VFHVTSDGATLASQSNRLTNHLRFALVFAGAVIAGVYVHEIGHAVLGWVQGVPVVPTPAKEYILQSHIGWNQKIWISLGGVAATAFLVLGSLLWYARERRPIADAVLAGVLVAPCFYTLRFFLAGRGHDGLEWQEAQTALGVPATGHAVDMLFLCLFLSGTAVWVARRRASLRVASMIRVAGLVLGGIALLIILQIANNSVFDRFFPETTTVNVPVMRESRHGRE
jgi:hypothetical protein